jgi:hypothetical protein
LLNQNEAENAICELRQMYRRAMTSSGAPEILWDYCLELVAELKSHTNLGLVA